MRAPDVQRDRRPLAFHDMCVVVSWGVVVGGVCGGCGGMSVWDGSFVVVVVGRVVLLVGGVVGGGSGSDCGRVCVCGCVAVVGSVVVVVVVFACHVVPDGWGGCCRGGAHMTCPLVGAHSSDHCTWSSLESTLLMMCCHVAGEMGVLVR